MLRVRPQFNHFPIAKEDLTKMTKPLTKFDEKLTKMQTRFDEIWSAFAMPIFAALISRYSLQLLAKVHWSLAMVAAAAMMLFVIRLLVALALWPPMKHPIRVTLSLFATVVCVGAAICSYLSFFIYSRNPAAYTAATELSIGKFYDFYVWYFIDMLPFKVWETLKVGPPINIGTRSAGAPLLLFRIVVATPVLTLIAKWYSARFFDASGTQQPVARLEPTSQNLIVPESKAPSST